MIDSNGRDIKNYTRTAYAFARAEDEDLALDQVLIVLKNNLSEEILNKQKMEFERLEELKRKLRQAIEEWDRKNPAEMTSAEKVEDGE